MTDSSSEKPRRRPRYSGKNPRQFHEKYKELQADRYQEDVAKVLAGGKTPAGTHRSIMVREILDVLKPQPGEVAVDCTLGFGGHARELLAAVQPGGKLIGIDADPIELPRTETRLRALGFPDESIVLKRMNYSAIAAILAAESPSGADLILADLGLSSMQIDDPARGFTYKSDGPLDMRMNPAKGAPASAFLARISEPALATLLAENADEPLATEIASAVVRAQARSPLTTTRGLAEVVGAVATRHARGSESLIPDTIRRVFQAVRIAVNDEFGSLDSFLRSLPNCLKPGGRVAILTFHSGEDRRVKAAFRLGLDLGSYSSIAPEVVRASAEERHANPRSSSAKLRWAIRA